VILVTDERALERNHSVYGLYPLVGSEVLTESGEFLGRVREFTFDPNDGAVLRLVFDAFGVPLIPETVVSCYAVGIEEVVSVGPTRIIVREGSESRCVRLPSRPASSPLHRRW
jgi:sporulation protein YlmC with PRC-barrel domain